MPAVPLPVLTSAPGRPLRVTPTDVSQFVRLEQCERFLRFRLAERAGQGFMTASDVTPQRISPLLSLSGRSFEVGVEKAVRARFRCLPSRGSGGRGGGDSSTADLLSSAPTPSEYDHPPEPDPEPVDPDVGMPAPVLWDNPRPAPGRPDTMPRFQALGAAP